MQQASRIAQPQMVVPSFGFTGEMASGKTTFANELRTQLEREFGIQVYRYTLSTKIVEIAVDLFDMQSKNRVLLGDISEKMREIDPAVWTNYVINKIKKNGHLPFIVDGIRYVLDEGRLRSEFPGFMVIRVDTDERQRLEVYKRVYGRYPSEDEVNNKGEGDVSKITHDLCFFNDYSEGISVRRSMEIIESLRRGTLAGPPRR
jgi:hypothetical protein